MSPREVRIRARKSQVQVAVDAGVSPPTVRVYEAAPDAVSRTKREALDATYARLRASLNQEQSAR